MARVANWFNAIDWFRVCQMIAFTLATLSVLSGLTWGGARIHHGMVYDQEVGSHLSVVTDAATTEFAAEQLATALANAERRGWTAGYTSIFYYTADEDLGIWHRNLQSALAQLQAAQQLNAADQSHILRTIRPIVSSPWGIEIYPHNRAYFYWIVGSVLTFIGAVIFGNWVDDNRYRFHRYRHRHW